MQRQHGEADALKDTAALARRAARQEAAQGQPVRRSSRHQQVEALAKIGAQQSTGGQSDNEASDYDPDESGAAAVA